MITHRAMKTFRTLAFFGTCILFAGSFTLLNAQIEDESLSEEELNSALVHEFYKDFDIIFEGVKKGLEAAGYGIDYASKRKKLIETKFQILTADDDFFDIMEQYGKIPYVRSPSWKNGRTSVSVRLEENDDGSVTITVQAELSAFEERFLRKWLYWPSNGVIEEETLKEIVTAVDAEEGSEL